MKSPIYIPSGAAKEYGDYALNIYTGCPHNCYYCFAPNVLHRDREVFHGNVQPREGIIEETRKQLEREKITGKLIHLCFTCDPYPKGYDSTATREIIKILKEHGNHVQILTKNGFDAERDYDLLDSDDWFGVTISGGWTVTDAEPNAQPPQGRVLSLIEAKSRRISTWVSCEPVLVPEAIYEAITEFNFVDKWKIGKLNYHPSDINWAEFGKRAEELCIRYHRDYYIKDSLRAEMERGT